MRQFPNTRLRRLRENNFSRRLMRETKLSCDDLIYPSCQVKIKDRR